MTKSDYLRKLRWDESQYQVMTAEECAVLKDKPNAVNHMYKIAEPSGKEAFGKDAFVVNIKFAEKFLNEEPQPAHPQSPPVAPVAEVLPPPPPVVATDDVPPPPPVKTFSAPAPGPVEPRNREGRTAQEQLDYDQQHSLARHLPEEIQEIAKKSPNVVIASIPKEEPAVSAKDWPSHVKTRMANLIGTGQWKSIGGDILRHNSGKTLHYEDLDEMENPAYTELLKEAQQAYKEAMLPKADDAAKKEAEQAEIEAKAKKASEERQAKNEEIRKQKEAEQSKPIDNLVIDAAKSVEDVEESKAEQKAFEENEGVEPSGLTVEEAVAKEDAKELTATEKLAKDTLARRMALYALGWKDDPKYKQILLSPLNEKGLSVQVSHSEILELSEPDFKDILKWKYKASIPSEESIKEIEAEEALQDEQDAKDKAETGEMSDYERSQEHNSYEDGVSNEEAAEIEAEHTAEKKYENDAVIEEQNKVLEETLGKPKEGPAVESKGVDILDVSKTLPAIAKEKEEPKFTAGHGFIPGIKNSKEESLAQSIIKTRDQMAWEIMLKVVPTTKKGPDKIAEFAYELADAMLKLKYK